MSSKNPAVTIRVPERTPFDKSHKWYGTGTVGTLVPLLVDEIIPNTKINCKVSLGVELPPLAADTLMNLKYQVTAFFVPMRLCYGGFEDFFMQGQYECIQNDDITDPTEVNYINNYLPVMPRLQTDPNDPLQIPDPFGSSSPVDWYSKGTLADYLGIRGGFNSTTSQVFTPLPFVAYHLIYSHWFRRSDVQKEPFIRSFSTGISLSGSTADYSIATLPYLYNSALAMVASDTLKNQWLLADNVSLFSLRQANFGFDYFTNSFPSASQPNMSVSIVNNAFSIASLRAANSLQQWGEMQQLPAKRYVDILKTRYNANLKDGVAQKPVCLGSANYEVYSRGVSVTADNDSGSLFNPFTNYAGGRVGNAYASGSDFIVDGFVANEPGYLFVIGCLIPRVNYSSGTRRYLRHYITAQQSDITDMATHMLQNVGNQPIFMSEIVSGANHGTAVFGYTDRYAEFMNYENEIHGKFVSGEDLEMFVAQRSISSSAGISDAFLKIPTDYLDNVTSTTCEVSEYGYQLSADFDYKVTMPLYEYSLPSLQNPAYEHGNPVSVHRGGFRF